MLKQCVMGSKRTEFQVTICSIFLCSFAILDHVGLISLLCMILVTSTLSSGLNLELNIEQDEYLDSFTPEAGVRVDITNQGHMPFPLERGLSLAPGFATAIGLRKV